MSAEIQTKWALITGASSGIGEAFAKRFARDGWSVILVARSLDKLQTLENELKSAYSVQAHVICSDLSKAGSNQRIYEELKNKKIHVTALVNNAGFGAVGSFLEVSAERQLEMIDLNVKALLELTHLFLPAMLEQKNGLVINVSSTASFQAMPHFATYAASKAFVTLFTEALWAEYRKTGVRVMNLCPGGTKTNFGVVAGKKENVSDWRYMQTAEQVVSDAFLSIHKDTPTIITNIMDSTLQFFERLLPRKWVILATQKVAKQMGYHK